MTIKCNQVKSSAIKCNRVQPSEITWSARRTEATAILAGIQLPNAITCGERGGRRGEHLHALARQWTVRRLEMRRDVPVGKGAGAVLSTCLLWRGSGRFVASRCDGMYQ